MKRPRRGPFPFSVPLVFLLSSASLAKQLCLENRFYLFENRFSFRVLSYLKFRFIFDIFRFFQLKNGLFLLLHCCQQQQCLAFQPESHRVRTYCVRHYGDVLHVIVAMLRNDLVSVLKDFRLNFSYFLNFFQMY